LVTLTVQQELMPLLNTVERRYKADGSVVTLADQVIQQKLGEAVIQLYPGSRLLGEEMPLREQQAMLAEEGPLWILDPIDGTSNFAAGMPFFSISLALVEAGQVTHGIVYDPSLDECFAAAKGQGAFCNQTPLRSEPSGLTLNQCLAIVDFKRLPAPLAQRLVQEKPYGSQRSLGSIALELCWLAAGRAHIYLHGKQHLWDYAAAQLILKEAGGFACTLQDDDVFIRDLQTRSTCAACDETLYAAWRDYLHIPRSES
jgi:myo-inositol-1(or 4)-monophosphatase